MACVPKEYPDGKPKGVRSWHLCRRRRGSEVIFGWQAVHDPEPPLVLNQGQAVLYPIVAALPGPVASPTLIYDHVRFRVSVAFTHVLDLLYIASHVIRSA